MKRTGIIIGILISLIICAIPVVLMLNGFFGCYREKMLRYYNNDENYSRLSCYIEEVVYFEDNFIYLHLSGANENELPYGEFKIIPSNYEELNNNCFFEYIKVGDEIEIVAALRIFGDGYDIPIVEIIFNDKCYLDFSTGKANLLKYVEDTEKF